MNQAPALPRAVQRAVNRLAAQRARREILGIWRRHQAAVQAEAADLMLSGCALADVLRELGEAQPPAG